MLRTAPRSTALRSGGLGTAVQQHLSIAASLGLSLVLVSACSGDEGDAAAREQPSGSAAGAELYAQSCASCHGADLTGTEQGPSHLSVVYEPDHHPDEAFRSAIANGARQHHWAFGDMPPVEGLSADEVDEIIAYVRAQQDERGFEPYPPD